MKKLVLMAVAIVAVSFASCGNKAADAAKATADSIRIADSIAAVEAAALEAEQGGLRGGLVYHNNLQVFNHKDTKTCRYIKAIYILIC